RNVTDIFITHGHGDHWFATGLLAERFGARVVATAGTISQMHANVAARPFVWDKVYPGIPLSPVTAVTVPDNRLTLEGKDLVIVERYPDRLGRTVLWATAQAVFGIREHPGEDPTQFIAAGWL